MVFGGMKRSPPSPRPSPPKERERGQVFGCNGVFRRVWKRHKRGTARDDIQRILRAPSPGGEGRGEGEPLTDKAAELGCLLS